LTVILLFHKNMSNCFLKKPNIIGLIVLFFINMVDV